MHFVLLKRLAECQECGPFGKARQSLQQRHVDLLVVHEKGLGHIELAPFDGADGIFIAQDGIRSLGIEGAPPQQGQQDFFNIRENNILLGDIGAAAGRVAGGADGICVHFEWCGWCSCSLARVLLCWIGLVGRNLSGERGTNPLRLVTGDDCRSMFAPQKAGLLVSDPDVTETGAYLHRSEGEAPISAQTQMNIYYVGCEATAQLLAACYF